MEAKVRKSPSTTNRGDGGRQNGIGTMSVTERDRVSYNRVILHDLAPTNPSTRVFIVSIKKSGFSTEDVTAMTMSDNKRKKAHLLNIYEPPRHFQLLAKVESTCTNNEAMLAVKAISDLLHRLLKDGLPVEEAISAIVTNLPGHVRHGMYYQLKSLPPKKSIPRFDRNNLWVSESDDVRQSDADEAARRKAHQDAVVRAFFLTFHYDFP